MNPARAIGPLLYLAAAVGCTSEAATPKPPAPSPSATSTTSPDPLPTATVAPPQFGDPAGTYGPARGNAVFSYAAGARDVPVSFSFECQGTGTLRVRVPVLHADFPVECDSGELGAKGADFAVPAARLAGTVHVTAPPGVTWAGAVGRGGSEKEEPSVRQRGPGEGS